jgi:methylamine dehydrogenase accessory protein MauD
MTSLGISELIQLIVILCLCGLCALLARQMMVLQERIAPMGALALNRRLAGGDAAPSLSLTTLSGGILRVGGSTADTPSPTCHLLFFMSPFCSISRSLFPVLKSIQQSERTWLCIILATDGDDIALHQKFVRRHQLERFPYVMSEALGRTYGISRVPYGVLIGKDGIIIGLGIVNSREHLESLLEAKRLGIPTVQAYLNAGSDQ